jgi:hypothetical protein
MITFQTFLDEFVFNNKFIPKRVKGRLHFRLYSKIMKIPDAPPGSGAASGPRLVDVVLGILRRPQKVLLLWNWKSALLSVALRGPIFFTAGARRGWQAALSALLIETIFCAVSAGFYGAVVQIVKDAEPQWLTAVFLTVAIPVLFQALEYFLHWFQGTPHLQAAALVSLFVSAISALFNWYAMRRGTLLMGREGGGFGGDLRRLPGLLFGFFAVLPKKMARNIRLRSSKIRDRIECGDLLDER